MFVHLLYWSVYTVNNVFLNNLERVANIVRIQSSNPNLTTDELKGLGIDISFECDAKLKINEPPPYTPETIQVTEAPATTEKVREIEDEIMLGPDESPSEISFTESPEVMPEKITEVPDVEPNTVIIETASAHEVGESQTDVPAVEKPVDSQDNFDRGISGSKAQTTTSVPLTESRNTITASENNEKDTIVVPEVKPLNQATPEAQMTTTEPTTKTELPISHQTTG